MNMQKASQRSIVSSPSQVVSSMNLLTASQRINLIPRAEICARARIAKPTKLIPVCKSPEHATYNAKDDAICNEGCSKSDVNNPENAKHYEECQVDVTQQRQHLRHLFFFIDS